MELQENIYIQEAVKLEINNNTENNITENINAAGLGAAAMPEFVGTTVLDTIGLVIPGIDDHLREKMKLKGSYKCVGLISSRTGAAGQIVAVDDAVKETNTEVVSIMLPRDTKGWGGHGNYIVIGADTVADARRAVEIALERTKRNSGEIYLNDAGHLEMAFSASADQAIGKVFGIAPGRAFGFMCGSPAAIGLVMADLAVKSADVEIARYMTPDEGTSHSNEVILAVTGDTSAVRTAVITAREAGKKLLTAMGGDIRTLGDPYIL